jgi:DNA-binding transcriptional regulator YiaG
MYYLHDGTEVTRTEIADAMSAGTMAIRPCTLTSWTRPTAGEIRELLRSQGWTGSVAAQVAGVNPRTVRKWTGGESLISYDSWRLLIEEAGIAE